MPLRWTQRYTDFCRSLEQLKKYVHKDKLTELEEPGFIQTFEFVSELAKEVVEHIRNEYYHLFRELAEALKQFEPLEETNDVRT